MSSQHSKPASPSLPAASVRAPMGLRELAIKYGFIVLLLGLVVYFSLVTSGFSSPQSAVFILQSVSITGILALGGFQGFIGWWMVSSGLAVRTDVSQYRLAAHLITACLIFASCMWILRGLSPHSHDRAPTERSKKMAIIIACFALFQIYLGALVAGLDAGFAYNTWPLMDGSWIPGDLLIQKPVIVNFFENPKTVQYIHRLGAYVLFALVLMHMIASLRAAPNTTHARRSVVLFALVTLQAAIGITTLVLQVPLHWALLHQGGALVVLGFAVAHWRGFVGEYPRG